MTTERLHFQREHQPAMVELRYETDSDARVREYLIADQNMLDDEIDELLRNYHRIGQIRAQLGIK